ncbi:hypothetical protein [Polaromonas sp.]|uniref:hypothetical protein n=1 Tax=Polaromonas sp. TaxID=1869339 RepID=UPI003750E0D7
MNDLNPQLALLCAFLALLCLLMLVRMQRLEGEPRPNLRDYFAAYAMSGYIVGTDRPKVDVIAKVAYEVADAMIKARGA